MKVRDIVELAIRLVGVVFLYTGLSAVPMAIGNFCPIFPHLNFRSLFPSLVLVGWPLAVGWYLIQGAPWLMRQAFKNQLTQPPAAQPKPATDLFGSGTTPR